MVIDDLDIESAPVFPTEADSPSFVDPYAVLTPPVAFQCFQPIAGWRRQVPKNAGTVKVQQLPARGSLKCLEACYGQIVKQVPGIRVFEGLDHRCSMLPIASYVKSNSRSARIVRGDVA
jgi:hypothetical protein